MRYFSKSYWIFLLMSTCAGILTYLIASTFWCIFTSFENWFLLLYISWIYILPFVLVSMIVAPWKNFNKSFTFLILYLANAIVFSVILFMFDDMSAPSMRGWAIMFIIGWLDVSFFPVRLLVSLTRRWLCKSN